VIIFHAAVNATGAHIMPAFSAPARDTIWLLFAALNVAIAVAIAFLSGFRRPALDTIEAAPYEEEPEVGTHATRTGAQLKPSAT
jgi:hypothetical protein